jgi:hypothetical protein
MSHFQDMSFETGGRKKAAVTAGTSLLDLSLDLKGLLLESRPPRRRNQTNLTRLENTRNMFDYKETLEAMRRDGFDANGSG